MNVVGLSRASITGLKVRDGKEKCARYMTLDRELTPVIKVSLSSKSH